METVPGIVIKGARMVLPAAALVLLVVMLSAAMLQDRLIYFPAKATVAEVSDGQLQPWPSPDDFRGLVAEPPGSVRATVIVFHGNAGHAGHRRYYVAALNRLGLRVILAEYPGYGPRSGAVGEDSLVADAAQAIARAHRLHGGPLLVIGESLGAGVAAAASARQRELVTGLFLITPWDELKNVAAHHYPWLPVSLFLRDGYDSAANLGNFGRPVLVAVAERDAIVPARFGTALYQSISAPRRLAVVEGAGHNDWIARVDDAWWRDAVAFLLGNQ